MIKGYQLPRLRFIKGFLNFQIVPSGVARAPWTRLASPWRARTGDGAGWGVQRPDISHDEMCHPKVCCLYRLISRLFSIFPGYSLVNYPIIYILCISWPNMLEMITWRYWSWLCWAASINALPFSTFGGDQFFELMNRPCAREPWLKRSGSWSRHRHRQHRHTPRMGRTGWGLPCHH